MLLFPYLELLGQLGDSTTMTTWMTYVPPLVVLVGMILFVRYLTAQSAREETARQHMEQQIARLETQLTRIADGLSHLSVTTEEQGRQIVEAMGQMRSAPAAPSHTVTATPEIQLLPEGQGAQGPVAGAAGGYLNKGKELLSNPEANYPDNLLEAKACFEKELDGPFAGEAYTCLSETQFWLGELASTKEEMEKYYGEGVAYGKKSVQLQDDKAAAHLWYAANMGAHGVTRGIMSSLFYLGDIEKHGNRAIALDEKYFYGAPLRLMGRFYHQCPAWPIGKGDAAKSIQVLERALAIGPEFLMNHLYLAESYLAKRKKNEARAVLEKLVAVKEYALMPRYMQAIQRMGKGILDKL